MWAEAVLLGPFLKEEFVFCLLASATALLSLGLSGVSAEAAGQVSLGAAAPTDKATGIFLQILTSVSETKEWAGWWHPSQLYLSVAPRH